MTGCRQTRQATATALCGWTMMVMSLLPLTSNGFVVRSPVPRRTTTIPTNKHPLLLPLPSRTSFSTRTCPLFLSSWNDAWNPIHRHRHKPKRDFYTLLQISRQASKKEIKAAYRKLAKKWHPDAHHESGKSKATEMFQTIARAYEVLSDPKLKKKYDLYGEGGLDLNNDDEFGKRAAATTTSWADWTRHSSPFGGGGGEGNHYDDGGSAYGSEPPPSYGTDGFGGGGGGATGQRVHSDDFFGSVDFGGRGWSDSFSPQTPPPPPGSSSSSSSRARARTTSTPMPGSDLMFDLQIDMKTAMFGGTADLSIRHLQHCEPCQGSGFKSGSSSDSKCPSCQGTGVTTELAETPLGLAQTDVPCPTCRGTGHHTPRESCSSCHGEGLHSQSKVIAVPIPAGVKDGKTLCLEGQGDAGLNGGPAGNIYVYLKVLSDHHGRRNNNNHNTPDDDDGDGPQHADPFEANGRHAHTHYHDYSPPPSNNGSSSHSETYNAYLRNNHEAFRTTNNFHHRTKKNDKESFFGKNHANGNSNGRRPDPKQNPFVRNGYNDKHMNNNNGVPNNNGFAAASNGATKQANGASHFRNNAVDFGTFFDRRTTVNVNGKRRNNHSNHHRSHYTKNGYSVGTSHGFKTKSHHKNGFATNGRPSKQDFFKTTDGAGFHAPPPPPPPSGGGGGVGTASAGATKTGTREIVVGEDLVKTLEIDVTTARIGGEVKVGFRHMETCLDCNGVGHRLGPDTCFACGGTGLTHQTSQTPLGNFQTQHNCAVCRGTGRTLQDTCKRCRGQGARSVVKELNVRIPPHTEDGHKMYLRGEGNAGPFGGPPGDLYVYVRVVKQQPPPQP